MKNKNIYMGADSTANLPVFGKKVDTDYEICMNTIATGYDALNKVMLTRSPGIFKKTTNQLINQRFQILKALAKKYSPDKLPAIESFRKISIANNSGQISDKKALDMMIQICFKNGIDPNMLHQVKMQIDQAEMMKKMNENFKPQNMFPGFQQPKRRMKTRSRRR